MEARFEDARTDRLWSLHKMETNGSEPDVVGYDELITIFLVYRPRLQKDLVCEKKLLGEVLRPVLQSFDGLTLEYELKSTSEVSYPF